MPARSDTPDLNEFLDAYGLLGVEYGASPPDIARAFKRQAREHHPDRYPSGSAEQQQATARMAAINAAYRLIRDAPLRHHRISTGARADDPWTVDELDAAMHRARRDVLVSRGISVLLSGLGVGLCLFRFPIYRLTGSSPAATIFGIVLGWIVFWLAAQTRAGLYAYRVISNCGSLVRIVPRAFQLWDGRVS